MGVNIKNERFNLIDLYAGKLAEHNSVQSPAIMIAGPSRTGKTNIAQAISTRFGYRIIYLDMLRDYYYDILDPDDRLEIKMYAYNKILESAHTGYVLEGFDPVLRNECWTGGDRGLSLDLLIDLNKKYSVKVILVGYSNIDIEKKTDEVINWQIKTGDCCMLNKDREEIKKFIEYNVTVSHSLKEMSSNLFDYYDISTFDFINGFNSILNQFEL